MTADSYASVNLQAGYQLHGHYRILSILGRGGFSFTYRAQDTTLDRIVAIKEYFPSSLCARTGLTVSPIDGTSRDAYEASLKSFIKEAQTLARFRNEHICSVLDYFRENGTAYLVMPYISGESLDVVLKKCPNGVMNSGAVRKLVLPLLNALRDVHSASCMHRDIKPSNIYIGYNGEPILIDFGAARETVGRTHGYTIVLTPQYAPPEQSTADISSQGPWTDIYALAAVAYRCLMGTPPPEAQKRVFAVASGEADPLAAKLPYLRNVADAGLYEFITKALVLPYAKRIRSVDEVERILKAAPVSDNKDPLPNIPKNTDRDGSAGWFVFLLIGCISVFLCGKYLNNSPQVNQNYNTIQKQSDSQNYKNYNNIQKQDENRYYNEVKKVSEAGIGYYQNGYFSKAVGSFNMCLGYNNPNDSQYIYYIQAQCANFLAIMYSEGKGVQADEKAAFKLFQQSANAGYPSGMFNLAKRYFKGQGTKQNTYLATIWYEKAAIAGDADAAEMLGYIYDTGNGNVKIDRDKALRWYKKAAEMGKSDKNIQDAIKRLQRAK